MQMLTANDVSLMLKVDRKTAYRIMEQAGCYDIGNGTKQARRVLESDLLRYLQAQKKPATVERTPMRRAGKERGHYSIPRR